MSADIRRTPALQRRSAERTDAGPDALAEAIPDRDAATAAAAQREPLNTSLQVRIRATTRARLDEAVRKLQYERRDSRISLARLTDTALDTWLSEQGL